MRLTNAMRDRIIEEATEKATAKDLQKLEKQEQRVALALYRATISPSLEQRMRDLGDRMFEMSAIIYLPGYGRIPLPEPKPFPYNQPATDIRPGSHLSRRVEALVAARQEYRVHRSKFRAATRDLVYAANTVNQLRELWPGVEKYVSAETLGARSEKQIAAAQETIAQALQGAAQ